MPRNTRSRGRGSAGALAALLLGAGITHLAHPQPYDSTIPRALPGPPRAWTVGSGIAELALGTAVALPRGRRRGALASAAFLLAVFPANVTMAYRWRRATPIRRAIAFGRLPMQAPLIGWALAVARDAEQR